MAPTAGEPNGLQTGGTQLGRPVTPESPGDREPFPDPLAEVDPYPAIREALERRIAAGASHGEAVRQVAAELDEEDRREMIELGLSCIILGTFD